MLGQEIKPEVIVKDNNVEIKNFRDFDWTTKNNTEKKYQNIEFNLNQLTRVDLVTSR
jgi:hypothetical protein